MEVVSFDIKLAAGELEYSCSSDDTLLRGALRAGLGFPYECNSGGCGSCKFSLLDGEVDVLWRDAPGLTPRDKRKGKQLGCQCRPKQACTIKVDPEPHFIPAHRPLKMHATLKETQSLTSDMIEFRFRTDHAAEFLPGQYALFDLENVNGWRGYSMSNLPNDSGEWHFIIKRALGGEATTELFDHFSPGDSVTIDGPYGLAYLRPDVRRDIVCVAGGSGLSPIISIVRAVAIDPRVQNNKVHMFYGGRGLTDICTPELVEELEIGDRLMCYNACSDTAAAAKDGWQGECCLIHELVEKQLGGSLSQYEHYFCGPPPMTEAVQRMLMIDHKVPFEQIHFDRFF